jgi:hypothetical protein
MILYEILLTLAIIGITLPATTQLMISTAKTITTTSHAIHKIRETQFMAQVLRSQLKDTTRIHAIGPTSITVINTTLDQVEYGIHNNKLFIRKGLSRVNYSDKVEVTQFRAIRLGPQLLTITLNTTPITIHLPNAT